MSLRSSRAFPTLLLATVMAGGCTAHAPRRVRLSETAPQAVTTSVEALGKRAARVEVQRHSVEVHPDFTLAFVEFDDQGRFWSRAQLELLCQTLESESQRANVDGVVVLLFAHGWRHNADVCDENVACLRTYLERIAGDLASTEKLSGGKLGKRRLVGIYVGWRGLSASVQPFKDLTFWSRERVAHRIGSGDLIELLTRVDQFVRRQNGGGVGQSRLVIMGHSFGGTMIYTALANILKSRLVEAFERRGAGVSRPRETVVEGFGNLIVLVNPAFEASLYAPIHELVSRFPGFSTLQTPVLITVSSETDRSNTTWFPLGRIIESLFERTGPNSGRNLIVTAVGNYRPFWTHRLAAAPGATIPPRVVAAGFGAAKGCRCPLRLEPVGEGQIRNLLGLLGAGGEPAPTGVTGSSTECRNGLLYGRAILTCVRPLQPRAPFWVVRASDDVVHKHSGLFTDYFLDFVRRVVIESIGTRTRFEAEGPGR